MVKNKQGRSQLAWGLYWVYKISILSPVVQLPVCYFWTVEWYYKHAVFQGKTISHYLLPDVRTVYFVPEVAGRIWLLSFFVDQILKGFGIPYLQSHLGVEDICTTD